MVTRPLALEEHDILKTQSIALLLEFSQMKERCDHELDGLVHAQPSGVTEIQPYLGASQNLSADEVERLFGHCCTVARHILTVLTVQTGRTWRPNYSWSIAMGSCDVKQCHQTPLELVLFI